MNAISGAGLIRSQAIQMTRQTGTLFSLVGAAVLLVIIGALAAHGMAGSVLSGSIEIVPQQIREIPALGFVFTQLLLGAACILLVTNEWSSGAIITSVATTQRKTGILGAKLLVASGCSLASMLVGSIATVAVANLFLLRAARSIDLQSPLVQRELLGLVIAGVCTAMIAVGMAFLIRKTALTLVVYMALMIVTPIAFGILPSATMQRVAAHLPLNASNYMMTTGSAPELGLSVPYAYGTMAAWGIGCVAAGWWRMTQTD